MKYTTNAQLKLPDYTDTVDVADFNENFTVIDGHLGAYILSDDGIHGLRYNAAEGRLEYYDPKKSAWVAATDEAGASGDAVSGHNASAAAHQSLFDAKANKADIAATASLGISNSAATYIKIADFGAWGTGAWYQKGFAMLITSRAGEMVWVAVSSDDSNTNAKAIRLLNTYSKILAIYYSPSESAIYVKANAWCNNINAHILSNINGDYVPTVTDAGASGLAADAVQITITEFGAGSGVTNVGDSSRALTMTGSGDRPTYNGNNVAMVSDIESMIGTVLSGSS